MVRPSNLIEASFPDNTTFVDTVRRAQGISAFSVEPGEDLRTFAGIFHPDTQQFPWARDRLDQGARVPLRDVSDTLALTPEQGKILSFDNPHIVPDGFNFEIVQFWVNFTVSVEVMVWGQKPSVDNPTQKSDYEPIGPLWAGGYEVENHERVAEPTERALFDPTFTGEQAVAVTVENTSNVTEAARGKVFIAAVQRDVDV